MHSQTATQSAPPPTVLVFSAHDNVIGHRRARALVGGLTRLGLEGQVIDKLSTTLADLMLVAEYRVVEVPFTVVIGTEGVVARLRGVPTVRELLELLDSFARLE